MTYLKHLVEELIKRGDLKYEINFLGTSMETRYPYQKPVQKEFALYEVKLQGNLFSTQKISLEYKKDGLARPFPEAWIVIRDLTDLSVYGHKNTVHGFVEWVQKHDWDSMIATLEQKALSSENKYTLNQLEVLWNQQWDAVKTLERAIGADVLRKVMSANRSDPDGW